jgi:signal transduction histidine kinase
LAGLGKIRILTGWFCAAFSVWPTQLHHLPPVNVSWVNSLVMKVRKQPVSPPSARIRSEKYLRIINEFAASLIHPNTVDGIIWEMARNVSRILDLYECVIYLVDETGENLVQKAAYGPKISAPYQIRNPISLPLGVGIVGNVALTGRGEIVNDTSRDPRYVVDDEVRYSEITVPLQFEGRLLGVIDSEHPEKNHYTPDQLEILETIASIASTKLAQTKAYESLQAQTEQLKTYNQRLLQFAYIVAHDLRSPVYNITGLLQLLNKSGITDAETLNWLEKIEQAAQKLRLNLDDLIQLATNEHLLHEQPGEVHWLALLADVRQSIEQQIADTGATIISHFPAPSVSLPAVYLRSILLNLITNAIKYRHPERPPVVRVSTERTDNGSCLRVADNGKGIDLIRYRQKLFGHGERFDTSVPGNGFGLYIVKHQIEALGGTIEVASEPGSGTEFRVFLPEKYAPAQ